MDKNVLILAYLGDAIYELYIREYLVEHENCKISEFQNKAICYVSANNQSKYLAKLLEQDFFTKEEQDIIFRARNHKGNRHPKNTDILSYKHATALEAVLGYLSLQKEEIRIKEIMEKIINEKIG